MKFKHLLFLVALFLPLQFTAIPIGSSKIDLSTILLLVWSFAFGLGRYYKVFIIAMCALLGISWVSDLGIPLMRQMSAAVFYSLLLSALFSSNRMRRSDVSCFIYGLYASLVLAMVSYIIYHYDPYLFGTKASFFDERSISHLYFLGMLFLILFDTKHISTRLKPFLLVVVLIPCLTLPSVHLFTLLTALLIVASNLVFSSFVGVTRRLMLPLIVLRTFLAFLILSGLVLVSSLPSHIAPRLLGLIGQYTERGPNISSVIYLSGVKQALESIRVCPVIGCGPGSPGFVGVDVDAIFLKNGLPGDLISTISGFNQYDCYSLLLRSIVELGPIVSILLWSCLLYLIAKPLLLAVKTFKGPSPISSFSSLAYCSPALAFCLVLLLGSLVKEPHLYRSLTFCPIILGAFIARSSEILRT